MSTGQMGHRGAIVCPVLAALLFLSPVAAAQSVTGGGYADVAPYAFSFVAAADAPVTTAALRVFSDPDALNEVTGSLAVSERLDAPLLDNAAGFAAFQVSGATPQTTYNARLTLDFGAGPVDFPATTPLPAVQTGTPLPVPDAGGVVQFNALATSAAIASVSVSLLNVPASPWALSSLTIGGLHAFDLNNAKDGSGDPLAVALGTSVTIEEWFGAACPQRPVVARTRRVADATPGGVLQYVPLERCFFADANCDDTVDVLDVQYLLGFFESTSSSCGFNDDLDADASGTVDLLELQALLNRFGDVAPF